MVKIKKELPYPPTVNHYYGKRGKRTFIEKVGKAYRKEVYYTFYGIKQIKGNVKIHVDVFPPDNKVRDIDNINKCLYDAIEYSGIIENDKYIIRDSHDIHNNVIGGKLIVTIESTTEEYKKNFEDFNIGDCFDYESKS